MMNREVEISCGRGFAVQAGTQLSGVIPAVVSDTRRSAEGGDEFIPSPSRVPTASNRDSQVFQALQRPAASSCLDLRQARHHRTEMRTKLSEAQHAARQTERDLREIGMILRRWPAEERTQQISWTDENGDRQTNVRCSEAEIQQLEHALDNQRLRQDDQIASLQRIVDRAHHSVEDAQRDYYADMQMRSNLSRMRHETSMSIIRNIGR